MLIRGSGIESVFCAVCVLIAVTLVLAGTPGDPEHEGKVYKGNRNALYLVQKGEKRIFPDFNTFDKMGYNTSSIIKIADDLLNSFPLGPPLPPIAVFRPDDYMYHQQCDDPDRMITDIGVVPNMGNFRRYVDVLHRVKKTKNFDILALGGSITAGGYFMEFTRLLQVNNGLNVTVHNHGHGATEITYTIFCVDLERYSPDLVLIDFSVNDYGHPKLLDALLRKVLSLKSRPMVALVNLWVHANCPQPRYMLHSFYYQIAMINVCSVVNLCYGKSHLPPNIYLQYSKTDGVHPWGPEGVPFLGKLLYAWWKRLETVTTQDTMMDLNGKMVTHTHSFDVEETTVAGSSISQQQQQQQQWEAAVLPPPLYASNPIGLCTRCDALADDADARLTPVSPPKGWHVVTRTKIGYGGFNPTDSTAGTPTKSFRRSWQAEKVGSEISFPFFGSSVKIAIWQRRDGMGVIHAHVDGNTKNIAKASGFFKGYTWAMERNNTGRSEIMPLFEGLEDKEHVLTLTVSDEPANVWVKGHMVQVFALLSASDDAKHCSKPKE